MNKKMTWGIIIILLSMFYAIQAAFPKFLSESIMKYVFNYQVILIVIGIFFLIQKKKMGWFVLATGIYLYLKEFLGEYFDKGFPILMLTGGIVLLVIGFNEKKIENERKGKSVFRSSIKPEKVTKESEIEEAEEIK